MNVHPEIAKKIQELQTLEQNIQGFLAQKQGLQVELQELQNALDELSKSSGEVYKILAGAMIKTTKDTLIKELNEKKKILEMRFQAFEKQEAILDDKSSKLRDEINQAVKKENKK